MRIGHRSLKSNLLIAAALTLAFGGATTAQANAQTQVRAWECPGGFSCYYDGANGTNRFWIAPSPGCFDLGRMTPPLNDRLTSVNNQGGGAIDLYNWTGTWTYLTTIPVGRATNLPPNFDNITDMVCIN